MYRLTNSFEGKLNKVILVGVIVLGCFIFSKVGNASSAKRWVYGSWVNVRAEANIDSSVIANIAANTQVTVVSEEDGWCKITENSIKTSGFIACRLLVTQPLSVEKFENPDSPDYSPLRAFWIAPSLHHLRQAGDYYEVTMLDEEQKRMEKPTEPIHASADLNNFRQPVRPKIREFEAMKDLFKNGLVVPRAGVRSLNIFEDDLSYLLTNLGPVNPSFFNRLAEVAPAYTGLERLSSQFGIKVRMRVINGAKWAADSVELIPFVAGAWDLGDVELFLETPVTEYTIGRTGVVSAMEWRGPEKHPAAEVNAASWYEAGFPNQTLGAEEKSSAFEKNVEQLPSYSKVEDRLVWFYSNKPLPYKNVSIKVRRIGKHSNARLSDPTEPLTLSQGYERYSIGLPNLPVPLYYMDLDRDGIADLAVVELRHQLQKAVAVLERHVFANIQGEWLPIENKDFSEQLE